MPILDDLDKLPDYKDPRSVPEGQSLISKYQIPINHFEFEYVEKCNDGRELEKIFQILKSGEEGYYPDLIRCTEDRLRVIKPKSKYLRKSVRVIKKKDLKQEEVEEITNDLQTFVVNAAKRDKELDSRKIKKQHCEVEVRQGHEQICDEETKINEKRISSTDYTLWDKYDPDTELLKMDIEEEKQKKVALEEKEQKEKERKEKAKLKKSVTFNQFATEAEAIFFSEREREKGNEFFKAGDLQDALHCYTTSIQSKTTINNLNNRAVTYLKLKKYQEAVNDCDKVLMLDKENVKANLRKAEALFKLEKFENALEAVEVAIQRDPNNSAAQGLADSIRRKCCREVNTTRLKIVEIEE